jgi:hypothetical protein
MFEMPVESSCHINRRFRFEIEFLLAEIENKAHLWSSRTKQFFKQFFNRRGYCTSSQKTMMDVIKAPILHAPNGP